MTTLLIAEKPSVGRTVAPHLGGKVTAVKASRGDSHLLVGDEYIVTWVFGHILEQFKPEDYDPKYSKWRDADLPILPAPFKLKPVEKSREQLQVIKGLLQSKNVTNIIHAGDPDREGQLLIDEILEYFNNKKPVRRLHLNSQDEKSVIKALQSMRPNTEFSRTLDAAKCRSEADWIMGINGTRAFSNAKDRGTERDDKGQTPRLAIGRVQTPVLALVVKRDESIKNFKPENYITLTAEFQHKNGTFTGTWRPRDGQAGLDTSGRLTDAKVAAQVIAAAKGKAGQITEFKDEPVSETPPLPHHLASIQMESNRRYGLGAQQVLDICQALYETHKVASYPRTDIAYLKEEAFADAPGVLKAISAFSPEIKDLASKADTKRRSAAWNSKKVEAHHGLMPTGSGNLKGLNENEKKVFDLICRNYIAQFYGPYNSRKAGALVQVGGQYFQANGRTPVDLGWKVVFSGLKADEDDSGKKAEPKLPAMAKGDAAACKDVQKKDAKTKPPSPYTEATLLQDMMAVDKFVTDPKLKARLKECKGIGTPATQSKMIEKLLETRLIRKQGKQLRATDSGINLVKALPSEVTDAATTAIWETLLSEVQSGKLSREDFMAQQGKWSAQLVDRAKSMSINLRSGSPSAGGSAGGVSGQAPRSARATGDRGASNHAGSAPACPDCTKPMRVLTATKGPNAGNQFYGCTGYPNCKKTMPMDDKGAKTALREPARAAPPARVASGPRR